MTGAGPIEAIEKSVRLTRGRLGQVFRWLIVSGLVVGVTSLVIGAVVDGAFGGIGQPILGALVRSVAVAPLELVSAIVIVRLAAVLSGPQMPPEPQVPVSWSTPA
jgi:hypothetical protein